MVSSSEGDSDCEYSSVESEVEDEVEESEPELAVEPGVERITRTRSRRVQIQ